ncbi:MAG: DUF4058 family protein [Caldilineaceae bacterium]
MTPVRSIKNQYRGINAHLHSYWQSAGGWHEFHATYIIYLANTLKAILLPMGYTAAIEPSLQIRRLDAPAKAKYPESDITIYDAEPQRLPTTSRQGEQLISTGELVLPLAETLFTEPVSSKELNAIKIYALTQRGPDRGEPVVWIEVLSPSNKPDGRDGDEYLSKRLKIIENGIVFVEIDYLHESSPTLTGIPNYRARQNRPADADAHPYRILIVDPRPDVVAGVIRVSQFDVDEPLPTLSIALRGADVLAIDFGAPYHQAIQDALYGLELVDYSVLPQNFDRYSPADQARIVVRMLAVLDANAQGVDLESGPFPVQPMPLETALERLATLTTA